jgi:hypothetical protein
VATGTVEVQVKVSDMEQVQQVIHELAVTQRQLDVLGEYFLLALNCLPGKQLKVSLTEQALLGEVPLVLQARSDEHGNVIFRAVEDK